ncbi:MAG TPA: nuclear transport factor 2 family protein [Myxococcota bacterium]|nr:nuclear transport factor 2 family protein [Myxococcota bacterium]HRY97076.1 nuclear transport factor 2 family protein [Myxococcota bacterium]HSA21115.1 nuclear transport factor 2 family protein [Myxococcota bacterium]
MQLEGALGEDAARRFADSWLPAWTGNRPEVLAGFYAPDAFYLDPAVPRGLQGREALLGYFRKLLARYPDWVWTQRSSIPMAGGFVNLWHARVPTRGKLLELDGVCLVQLEGGLIRRNEVYFDRTGLL